MDADKLIFALDQSGKVEPAGNAMAEMQWAYLQAIDPRQHRSQERETQLRFEKARCFAMEKQHELTSTLFALCDNEEARKAMRHRMAITLQASTAEHWEPLAKTLIQYAEATTPVELSQQRDNQLLRAIGEELYPLMVNSVRRMMSDPSLDCRSELKAMRRHYWPMIAEAAPYLQHLGVIEPEKLFQPSRVELTAAQHSAIWSQLQSILAMHMRPLFNGDLQPPPVPEIFLGEENRHLPDTLPVKGPSRGR